MDPLRRRARARRTPVGADPILLRPAQVFDGVTATPHPGWEVLLESDRIAAVGVHLPTPPGARIVELSGTTLMPGMIEGHSHLFLQAYNETAWDEQVLREALALRTSRAVVQARATLLAGFTSEHDLGTEGAGYADVGLKEAIDQGIGPGPRLIVATRAIVSRGAYGPKGFEPGVTVPQGAQEVSGADEIVRAVRDQIAGVGRAIFDKPRAAPSYPGRDKRASDPPNPSSTISPRSRIASAIIAT